MLLRKIIEMEIINFSKAGYNALISEKFMGFVFSTFSNSTRDFLRIYYQKKIPKISLLFLRCRFPDRKPRRSLTSTTTTASTTTQEIQDTSSLTASAIRRRQRPFFASDSDDEDLFA